MAFVSQLHRGAVVVREFHQDYMAVVACAESWEDVVHGVVARLAVLIMAFPHIRNWVMVTRTPLWTRFQRWKDALGAQGHGYSLWKDSVCAELLRENHDLPHPPLGATCTGDILHMLSSGDTAAILLLQSEPDSGKLVDMKHLDAVCPLPALADRAEWMANPFIVAGLLLPLLGRIAASGELLLMVGDHLPRRRRLAVVFDSLHLPIGTNYRHLKETTHTTVLRTSGNSRRQSDQVTLYPFDTLSKHCLLLRTSPDPVARTAAWMLLSTLCFGRMTLYLGNNRVPAIIAMAVIEHQITLLGASNEAKTFGELHAEPLPHLGDLISGRIKLMQITDDIESGLDLTTLALNLRTLYWMEGSSVAHAAIESGILLEDAGVPEMLQRDAAGDEKVGGCTRLCVPHTTGPVSYGMAYLEALFRKITPNTSRFPGDDETPAEATRRVATADYIRACHNSFLLNHYVGEVYAPFERMDKLVCEGPHGDGFGFGTWLKAVHNAGTYVYRELGMRWVGLSGMAADTKAIATSNPSAVGGTD